MIIPTSPPLYVLPKNKGRAIIPKTIILLILGLIFYASVLLNLSLLELTEDAKTSAELTAGISIITLVASGIINAIRKSKFAYYFYQNQIIHAKTNMMYQDITTIQRKEKISDKLFKTYSLILNNQFKIKYIPQQINIQEYIEKMRSYASGR